jgi:hypothetical protein
MNNYMCYTKVINPASDFQVKSKITLVHPHKSLQIGETSV